MQRSAYYHQKSVPQAPISRQVIFQIFSSIVFFIGVNILFYWMLTQDNRIDAALYQILLKDGIRGEANVANMREELHPTAFLERSEGSFYYVQLSYTANPTTVPVPIYVESRIRQETYQTLKIGQQVEVIYSHSRPEIVALYQEFSRPLTSNVTFLLIMLNLIPGIALVSGLASLMRSHSFSTPRPNYR